MKVVLISLALLFIVMTVLPVFRHDWWVIRACDFPRQQIAVAGVLILGGYLSVFNTHWMETVVLTALAGAVAYQGYWIWPYTPYASVQVVDAPEPRPDDRLSVLVVNVCVHNRDAEALVHEVRRSDPDLLLVLEATPDWAEGLAVLQDAYPYAVEHTREDPYGIALYARYPLSDASIRFLVDDGIPSVHATVRLPSGNAVRFFGLHPRPPHPEEDRDTAHRDAELLLVGHEVERLLEEENQPVVVAGDFNDVSWSYVTLLMRRVSGLLDPRIGRGPVNTIHTRYPFARCPLDHILHSPHFTLETLERRPDIGSDHFPLLARLQLEPEAREVHERPYVDATMRQHAREEIGKAAWRLRQERSENGTPAPTTPAPAPDPSRHPS